MDGCWYVLYSLHSLQLYFWLLIYFPFLFFVCAMGELLLPTLWPFMSSGLCRLSSALPHCDFIYFLLSDIYQNLTFSDVFHHVFSKLSVLSWIYSLLFWKGKIVNVEVGQNQKSKCFSTIFQVSQWNWIRIMVPDNTEKYNLTF